MKLYDYFRSTASYRVRIALNLKAIAYEKSEVHLVQNGGEQFQAAYRHLNPQSLVPSLQDADFAITQSMAILEYLEEQYPQTPLLPEDPFARATARSIAQMIACDIHPLNNLRVLKYLKDEMGLSEDQKNDWYRHWVAEGFTALETRVAQDKQRGDYCCAGQVTFADICLIPQMYNAKRFECPIDAYPILRSINDYCLQLPAFQQAAP